MGAEFICDGCGRREPGWADPVYGFWHKPHHWYQRTDSSDGTTYVACSRSCIEQIERHSGKKAVIAPF
ncbi:MAG TPA: hypothetical protein VNI83_04680 [Vicinamibacterales bacterium]|nr:hypothetical protein [Vicinamibacterales bacterium]